MKYTLHDRVDYPRLKYEIVGPGSYDPKIVSTKGSCFSFAYKTDEKNVDNEVPGPGTYPNEVKEVEMSKREKKVFERQKMKSEKEKFRYFMREKLKRTIIFNKKSLCNLL